MRRCAGVVHPDNGAPIEGSCTQTAQERIDVKEVESAVADEYDKASRGARERALELVLSITRKAALDAAECRAEWRSAERSVEVHDVDRRA